MASIQKTDKTLMDSLTQDLLISIGKISRSSQPIWQQPKCSADIDLAETLKNSFMKKFESLNQAEREKITHALLRLCKIIDDERTEKEKCEDSKEDPAIDPPYLRLNPLD